MNLVKKTLLFIVTLALTLSACGRDENRMVLRRNGGPSNESGGATTPLPSSSPTATTGTANESGPRTPLSIRLQASVFQGSAPLTVDFQPLFESGSLETGDQASWTVNSVPVQGTDRLQYVFQNPGLYVVAYQVQRGDTLSSASVGITVTVPANTNPTIPPPTSNNPPSTNVPVTPVLDISPSTTSGVAPLDVSFEPKLDPSFTIRSHAWTVQNAASPRSQAPVSIGNSPLERYTFTAAGSYIVGLSVVLADGQNLSASVQIDVRAPSTPTGPSNPSSTQPNFQINTTLENTNPIEVILEAVNTNPNSAPASHQFDWEVMERTLPAPLSYSGEKAVASLPRPGVYDVTLYVSESSRSLQTVRYTLDLSAITSSPPIAGNPPTATITPTGPVIPALEEANLPGDLTVTRQPNAGVGLRVGTPASTQPPATPSTGNPFQHVQPSGTLTGTSRSGMTVTSSPTVQLNPSRRMPIDRTLTVPFSSRNLAHSVLGLQQTAPRSLAVFRKREGNACENYVEVNLVIRMDYAHRNYMNQFKADLYSCSQNRASCSLELEGLTRGGYTCDQYAPGGHCEFQISGRKTYQCAAGEDVATKPFFTIRLSDPIEDGARCTVNTQCTGIMQPHCDDGLCRSIIDEYYMEVQTPAF